VIPGVAPRPDHRNLQESRFSNFLCKAKKSFTSKREMSRRTDIPNTSSSTPKSSQGRRNKKTVLPMKIATSGDKEEQNQRRKHELCEYGTSREIFSENFDGTTQLRNGQTPVDGNKGHLDEEIMEDEGRRMKRKAREREREREREGWSCSSSLFFDVNNGVQFLFLKCKVLVSKLSG
ncbi:hypothetical protein HID58_081940, partial [Brassica napus]